jgi:hypothetical protein
MLVTPTDRGTSAIAPYFCCSRYMACGAAKLLSVGQGESGSFV